MILIVTYDLRNPGKDYDKVAKILTSAGSSRRIQGSVWLLDTQFEPSVWSERLEKVGDSNDTFFVAKLAYDCSWLNMSTEHVQWLRTRTSWQS